MQVIAPGQVWQNGRTAVQVSDADAGLRLALFSVENERLRYMDEREMQPAEAETFLESIHCILTDKVLVAAD
jgi:hypothetical protein